MSQRTSPVSIQSLNMSGLPTVWEFKDLQATYEFSEKDYRSQTDRFALIKELLSNNAPTCYYNLPSTITLNIAPNRITGSNHQVVASVTLITLEDGPFKGYEFLVTDFHREPCGHRYFVKCQVKAISRTVLLY